MDAHAAQLRHQMDETRAAMDAKLIQLEQRVSQMPAALLEQHVLGPVRGVQETAAWGTTLLRVARLVSRDLGALDWRGWCTVRGQHPNGSWLMRAWPPLA